MNTFYEELAQKGLSATKLALELAWTIPYCFAVDTLIGTDIITYKPIETSKN